MVRKRKRRIVYCELQNRSRICKKIRAPTLVASWAWVREEMVRNSHVQTEWKMGPSRWGHDAQLKWKRTSRIPWILCFGTVRFEKQRKRKIVHTFLWWRRHSRIGSSHNHFCQSAHYPRSSSGQVRRNGLQNLWLFRKYRETCCSEQFRECGYSNRNVDNEQITSDRWRRLPEHLQLIKLCSNVGITKTVAKGQYFTTLPGAELNKLERRGSCREYPFIQTTHSPKYEDPSSFGCGRQSPSRPLRNWGHDRIQIWWWNLFLGHGREWNKQIRDGDDRGDPREPQRWRWRQYRETCC